jgi:prevent-host-death family protein
VSTVNLLEAKTHLSSLIDALERGEEREVIIARRGRPAARLVPVERPAGPRIGVARGLFVAPDPDESLDAEVERLMSGGG